LPTNCSNNYAQFRFPEKLILSMILHALESKPPRTSPAACPSKGFAGKSASPLSFENRHFSRHQCLVDSKLARISN
jgi:hypothetical protein